MALNFCFILSHLLGINSHFLFFGLYVFSWDNSHPVATKAKLRHYGHMLRYQKLTLTTNIIPTLAICLYRLNIEYAPFTSSYFRKQGLTFGNLITFAFANDHNYCLTLACINIILLGLCGIKVLKLRKQLEEMNRIRDKKD